ncbi:MAG: GGDEF domain-containing protein [Deltaproteobacteria bacterium]|nr:GGDEF domain-containing protein [Deltaproteobacteria bacterium]
MENLKKPVKANQSEEITQFNELMDSSYELAKKLLPFLARRRIPLIPENYHLFYDYFLANNPELNRQLNDALQYESLFTPTVSRRLYQIFYDVDNEKVKALTQMGEKIGNISQSLELNLGQSLDSTGRFQQVLSDSAIQMESGDLAVDDMRDMVDSLLVETKSAMDSQTALADLIEASNRVIANLTAELKDQTRLASIDELTQLYNRRYMSQSFQDFAASYKPGDNLSLAIFDLDHFKYINDTYGHAIGDKVLMICAKIIKTIGGEEHVACRYGGEEFVLLCRGIEAEAAGELAESIRRRIEETQITIRGTNVPVTLSAGVSGYIAGEPEVDFISRADKALYEAKNNGRNRVIVFGVDSGSGI